MLTTDVVDETYAVERLLGHGGMSDVYLARDLELDRTVALKVLRESLATDEKSLERIRREARRAAKVTHPNVVTIHTTGETSGVPYIVMEHVEGESLSERLARTGRLDEATALAITDEICQALAAAHRHGLIHADIKPSNVLLTVEGRVKVSDFGIARAAGDDMTTQSSVLGTVTHVSPEHARGEPIDERSDVYSLGVVLYEMLAGRRPIDGETAAEVLVGHATREPEPLRSIAPDVSEAAERIAARALAKDPTDRYQSAEEMRRDVRRALAAPSAHETAELPLAPTWRDHTTLTGRVLVAGAGIAAALLLVAHLVGLVDIPGSTTTIPDVVGHDVDAARAILEAHDLDVGDVLVVYGGDDATTVAVQSPEAGEVVRRGSRIDLGLGDQPAFEPPEPDDVIEPEDRTAEEPSSGQPGGGTAPDNGSGNGPDRTPPSRGGDAPGRGGDGPPGQRGR